ncbi:MAG: cytochrome C oxidase subunit IV family protein [Bryobacteraceae bacterium]
MNETSHVTHHVTPVRTYLIVFLSLLVLTVTTTKVAEIELGEWNFVVAISIAITKALLVVLFFMHVKDSSALTKLFVCAGLFWMSILILITTCDYISRDWQFLPKWIQ